VHTPSTLAPARTPRRRRTAGALIAAGAALGILVTTGFAAAAPAAAATASATPIASFGAAGVPTALAGNAALADITAAATTSLDDARSTLAAATAMSTEIAASDLDLGEESTAIDTTALSAAIRGLGAIDVTPVLLLPDATETALSETATVTARISELSARLEAAREKKAAEEAAAKAAAEAKRKAEEAAKALAAANTVAGAQATAQQLSASQYGWGSDQFACLVSLWSKESGWNYQAYNSSSGATGIPQALPGSKMASAGSDWQTSATTQIRWGLGYIASAYGTPCAAWGHSQATNWY
jgi:hypothetical protein